MKGKLCPYLAPILLSSLTLVPEPAGSQQPPFRLAWERSFSKGPAGSACRHVAPTAEGGFIAVGVATCSNETGGDVYLIKIDRAGKPEWEECFDEAGNDEGRFVMETRDGRFVFLSTTNGQAIELQDIVLAKVDPAGKLLWKKVVESADGDSAEEVKETGDNGLIVVGTVAREGGEAFLIRTDASGGTLWKKTFGREGAQYGRSVQETPDGGFVVAGTTYSPSHGQSDAYLLKTDRQGNAEWLKNYGGPDYEGAFHVALAPDGGFVVLGTQGTSLTHLHLFKVDRSGDLDWAKDFEGLLGKSVSPAADGGYLVAASLADSGAWAPYLLKLDAFGRVAWHDRYGSSFALLESMNPTVAGGAVIGATSTSSPRLIVLKLLPGLQPFHRGDSNGDGRLDVSDGLCVLTLLFGGGRSECWEAVDADNDGEVSCSDAVYTLNYLFLGNAPPPDPGPADGACGLDPDPVGSRGDLGCAAYPNC